MQGSQRSMWTSPGPKAVREAHEVGLVDCAEHFGKRALDDLVFQRGYAEGPLSTVRLRDVGAPYRLRPVLASMHARAQIAQVLCEVLFVRLHRDPVDSRRCPPPLSPERTMKRVLVYMVQECSESGLGSATRCRVHSLKMRRPRDPTLCSA
jgi:hypothetical protein